jgi:hypothetical protein
MYYILKRSLMKLIKLILLLALFQILNSETYTPEPYAGAVFEIPQEWIER